jgi:hypothetical protein
MLKIFTPFGIKFYKKARCVKLSIAFNFLDRSNFVIKVGRIITDCETFGLQLFFESQLFAALVRKRIHCDFVYWVVNHFLPI